MTCHHVEEWILKSPDGELTRAERERLDAHLGVCTACRQVWEEHRRLAILARHWVQRSAPSETPADVFTAQVLARVAERRQPAHTTFWLPLLAVGFGVAALALLPHSLWPVLPNIGMAVRALPDWILASGQTLPADTRAIWNAAQGISFPAQWLGSLLIGACLLNAGFYVRAAQSRLKGSVS